MKKAKKVLALILSVALMLSLTTAVPAGAEETEYRDEMTVSVVNFSPVWGDKDSNVKQMKAYIEEAEAAGTDLILFPEMCVTGYAASSDPESEIYQMPVNLAESKDGETAAFFAGLADQYDMWIVYGATETIEGDSEHAYNSAFACSPEGVVTTYQKIHPVEGSWCTAGTTPTMLQTEWGPVGLSICYDTYATPELERIYAAYGSRLILNPTATSRAYDWRNEDSTGWEWYYKNRLETAVSRESFFIASANLVGEDGPVRENGASSYHFPGGSVVMGPAPWNVEPYCHAGSTDNKEAGVFTAAIDLSEAKLDTTVAEANFAPDLYAKWYQELADKKAAGESLSYTPQTTDGPVAAVAKCTAVWGDKDANVQMMIDYIKDAGEQGVKILVFPETILSGYMYVEPEAGEECMQKQLAETVPGPTSSIIAEYAKQYGMYIVYGLPELKDGEVYNSAAICTPDGEQLSFQKIHPYGTENEWAIPGNTPVILDTEWGKIGVSICMDGHFEPELERYYAAMGCTILIHPTTTSGNNWYRSSRMGSYTDRDGMAVITCNTTGTDGPNEESAFWSTSLIITKNIDPETGRTVYDPETGCPLNFNGTGTSEADEQGLAIAKMDLTGLGFSIAGFNPQVFADAYAELAKIYAENENQDNSSSTSDESSSTPDSSTALESSETTPNTGVADAASGFVIGGIALAVMFGCFGISFAYRKKEGRQK